MDIFNPSLCLAKQLKNSWSTNITTELEKDKIPIEVVEGVPRLKMVYDDHSKEDWFACAIPIQNTWEPFDASNFKNLSLNLYSENGEGGVIKFEDNSNKESRDFNISELMNNPSEEQHISIPLSSIKENGLNTKELKLIKFIGYKESAFYISEVCLK